MSLYLKSLDHGAPLVRKTAAIAVSFALFLVLALPALAVAARIVA